MSTTIIGTVANIDKRATVFEVGKRYAHQGGGLFAPDAGTEFDCVGFRDFPARHHGPTRCAVFRRWPDGEEKLFTVESAPYFVEVAT